MAKVRKPSNDEIYPLLQKANELLVDNNNASAKNKYIVTDTILPKLKEMKQLIDHLEFLYQCYYNSLK